MAKFCCSHLLILLLILSHQLLSAEGRKLTMKTEMECVNCSTRMSKPKSSARDHPKKKLTGEVHNLRHVTKSLDDSVDAFHPTNPGHSPGVGHSKEN
ncbi:hypothetical protein ACJRO7_034525 [Eucalyptus globulus]|uniref:Uncharacterized protein n=1 Tax=Eucalyptus globulus TaxID=34317 RepID=A0ABD3J3X7_EUCGL